VDAGDLAGTISDEIVIVQYVDQTVRVGSPTGEVRVDFDSNCAQLTAAPHESQARGSQTITVAHGGLRPKENGDV
jgi:hypothetical protein